MILKNKFFLIGLICLISLNVNSQSYIKGHINLDSSIWAPVAYLSIISDFDNMNRISNEMIIERASIDNTGGFSFNTQYLPQEDMLYRLHISKKSDPPASLIIGGKEENHFFLIANNHSTIQITHTGDLEFLKDVRIDGYYPNQMIHQVDEIASYLDSSSFNGSPIKIELIRNAIFGKLRYLADTCTNPLVSLYALYKSKFENNYPINQQFYRNFLSKWKKERSSYFIEFRKKIPLSQNSRLLFPFLIGLVCLIIGFLSSVTYYKFSNKNQNPLRNLSVQERKIFALILEGKSNKEISEILLIGLSTVKSHVNGIYSKLGINSRKDVMNLNLDK